MPPAARPHQGFSLSAGLYQHYSYSFSFANRYQIGSFFGFQPLQAILAQGQPLLIGRILPKLLNHFQRTMPKAVECKERKTKCKGYPNIEDERKLKKPVLRFEQSQIGSTEQHPGRACFGTIEQKAERIVAGTDGWQCLHRFCLH